jgi:hypothetical protein
VDNHFFCPQRSGRDPALKKRSKKTTQGAIQLLPTNKFCAGRASSKNMSADAADPLTSTPANNQVESINPSSNPTSDNNQPMEVESSQEDDASVAVPIIVEQQPTSSADVSESWSTTSGDIQVKTTTKEKVKLIQVNGKEDRKEEAAVGSAESKVLEVEAAAPSLDVMKGELPAAQSGVASVPAPMTMVNDGPSEVGLAVVVKEEEEEEEADEDTEMTKIVQPPQEHSVSEVLDTAVGSLGEDDPAVTIPEEVREVEAVEEDVIASTDAVVKAEKVKDAEEVAEEVVAGGEPMMKVEVERTEVDSEQQPIAAAEELPAAAVVPVTSLAAASAGAAPVDVAAAPVAATPADAAAPTDASFPSNAAPIPAASATSTPPSSAPSPPSPSSSTG